MSAYKTGLKEYLERNLNDLFSFSFCLLPDELQAQQLLLDALSVFTLGEKDLIEEFETVEDPARKLAMMKVLRKSIMRAIFHMASKRSGQLESSLTTGDNTPDVFFHLALSQRAVLYLKHKLNFDFSEIEHILGKPSTEVMGILSQGRMRLAQLWGQDFLPKFQQEL
jgi:DNA-directed RNA polymerase specialized sigma24 family protein